ncbi:MAG: hypothetical protein AB8V57_02910 [Coxiella endosymbiont of Dermacentor nuttalli]
MGINKQQFNIILQVVTLLNSSIVLPSASKMYCVTSSAIYSSHQNEDRKQYFQRFEKTLKEIAVNEKDKQGEYKTDLTLFILAINLVEEYSHF